MKLSLRIETGTLTGKTFELTEGFLTLGRGERCNVRFDPLVERVMSKEHCFIERKADGFYLTDNQSTNGTFLNSERIQTARLNSGDIIQFGKNGVRAVVEVVTDEIRSEQTRIAPHIQFPQSPQLQPTAVFSSKAAEDGAQHLNPPAIPTPQYFQPGPVDFRNSLSGLSAGSLQRQYRPEPEKSQALKIIAIVAGIIGLLICLLLVVLITLLSVGPLTAIVSTFVAFMPVLVYILPFILIDRYDPEPMWLLALAFAWGALVSIVFSFFANSIVGIGAALAVNPEFGDRFMAVAAAPIFEEGSKGLGLLLLLIFFRRYFDDILDGIVFAGVIALGFATVENVLYYGRAINGGGIIALILLFILRGVLSPFAHATFTSMTGIGCGIARETHSTAARLIFPVVGYLVAVCLHALWNGMAVFAVRIINQLNIGWLCDSLGGFESLCAFLIGYAVLQIPLFFGFVGFTIYVLIRQNRILKEMLAIDVARGLIPEAHMKKATSVFGSYGWLLDGILNGKFSARNKYLRTVGKLGLSYWHIQRATAAQGQTGSFQQNPILREEVLRWREKV